MSVSLATALPADDVFLCHNILTGDRLHAWFLMVLSHIDRRQLGLGHDIWLMQEQHGLVQVDVIVILGRRWRCPQLVHTQKYHSTVNPTSDECTTVVQWPLTSNMLSWGNVLLIPTLFLKHLCPCNGWGIPHNPERKQCVPNLGHLQFLGQLTQTLHNPPAWRHIVVAVHWKQDYPDPRLHGQWHQLAYLLTGW